VSAILFIGEEVILSRQSQKGIDKLGDGTGVRRFALGYEFTQDSVALLKQHQIEPIAMKDFGWTDERYIAIKSE
jgi:hypothetical protein